MIVDQRYFGHSLLMLYSHATLNGGNNHLEYVYVSYFTNCIFIYDIYKNYIYKNFDISISWQCLV